MAAELHIKTQAELCVFLGVSRPTVKTWIERGMPTRPDGFEAGEVIRWRLKQSSSATTDNRNNDEKRSDVAERDRNEADAVIKRAKAEQIVGRLINRDVVVNFVATLVTMIRTRLQAIPGELAGSVPPNIRHDVMVDLENKIDLILRGMADWQRSGEFLNAKNLTGIAFGKRRTVTRHSGKSSRDSTRGKRRGA